MSRAGHGASRSQMGAGYGGQEGHSAFGAAFLVALLFHYAVKDKRLFFSRCACLAVAVSVYLLMLPRPWGLM